MMPVVFTVGVLNFLVGFGLAVALRHRLVVPIPVPRKPGRAGDSTHAPPAGDPVPVEEIRDRLPHRWSELLDSHTLRADNFAALVLNVLWVDLTAYREQLLSAEDGLRDAPSNEETEAGRERIQALVSLNGNWTVQQRETARVLGENRRELGRHAALGNQLERLLLDQIRTIRSKCRSLPQLDLQDRNAAHESIISEVGQFADMVHHLRDSVHQAAANLESLTLESATYPPEPDETTGLPGRQGLEQTLQQWRAADPRHRRAVTVALIDLDRFGERNKQAGTRGGDRILNTVARYLTQLVTTQSQWPPVYRYGGQRFFIFLADCEAQEGTERMEKTRQAVEAAKLEYGSEKYSLTFSAGITPMRSNDDNTTLLRRAEELTDKAKQAGGNRLEHEDSSDVELPESTSDPMEEHVLKVE